MGCSRCIRSRIQFVRENRPVFRCTVHRKGDGPEDDLRRQPRAEWSRGADQARLANGDGRQGEGNRQEDNRTQPRPFPVDLPDRQVVGSAEPHLIWQFEEMRESRAHGERHGEERYEFDGGQPPFLPIAPKVPGNISEILVGISGPFWKESTRPGLNHEFVEAGGFGRGGLVTERGDAIVTAAFVVLERPYSSV